MIKINILGSCLSRDTIWFDNGINYEVPVYKARTSIVSNLQKNSFKLKRKDLNLSSEFQKDVILSDFNKTVYEELEENKSEYLMIDFIDERFSIAKIKINNEYKKVNYVTYSNELINSCFLDNYKYELVDKKWIGDKLYFDGTSLDYYLDKLIDKLIDIYNENKIIIHKAYMEKIYYDASGKKNCFDKKIQNDVEQKNLVYNYMYTYLQKYMPKSKSIDVKSEKKFLIDANHRWGLTTMHYEKAYYYEVLRKLKEITQ